MNARVTMALACAVVYLTTTVLGQRDAVKPAATNTVAVTTIETNVIGVVRIAGTARNPATVGAYTGDFSDPPTQGELRDFRDWCNSFFSASAR